MTEGDEMAHKHQKSGEIVGKLRQVEVLTAQGKSVIEAVHAIGVPASVPSSVRQSP